MAAASRAPGPVCWQTRQLSARAGVQVFASITSARAPPGPGEFHSLARKPECFFLVKSMPRVSAFFGGQGVVSRFERVAGRGGACRALQCPQAEHDCPVHHAEKQLRRVHPVTCTAGGCDLSTDEPAMPILQPSRTHARELRLHLYRCSATLWPEAHRPLLLCFLQESCVRVRSRRLSTM